VLWARFKANAVNKSNEKEEKKWKQMKRGRREEKKNLLVIFHVWKKNKNM
jgi:hypothetical protein